MAAGAALKPSRMLKSLCLYRGRQPPVGRSSTELAPGHARNLQGGTPLQTRKMPPSPSRNATSIRKLMKQVWTEEHHGNPKASPGTPSAVPRASPASVSSARTRRTAPACKPKSRCQNPVATITLTGSHPKRRAARWNPNGSSAEASRSFRLTRSPPVAKGLSSRGVHASKMQALPRTPPR